jgi:hypothetical protein
MSFDIFVGSDPWRWLRVSLDALLRLTFPRVCSEVSRGLRTLAKGAELLAASWPLTFFWPQTFVQISTHHSAARQSSEGFLGRGLPHSRDLIYAGPSLEFTPLCISGRPGPLPKLSLETAPREATGATSDSPVYPLFSLRDWSLGCLLSNHF